jgi:hypothetical protein
MKTHCGPRLYRRYRRPAPLPATRSQIRQKVDQIKVLYQFATGSDAGLWNEVMSSIEEQI